MAVGDRGTLVIQRPRTVKPGGVIRYAGLDYQSKYLLCSVGASVMVHESGTGEIDVHECWYERVIDARRARLLGRKRQHRWVIGDFICAFQLPAL